jgi:hypothetical protein
MARRSGPITADALDALPRLEIEVRVKNVWLFKTRLWIGMALLRMAGRCLGGIDRLTIEGPDE